MPVATEVDVPKKRQRAPRKKAITVACPDCGKHFARPVKLEQHITKKHREPITSLRCLLCEKSRKTEASMRKHLEKMHPEEFGDFKVNWISALCAKLYDNENSTAAPVKDTPKEFSCQICKQKFEHES
jgi:uncharacterized C2H2 Zn-finger protein